MKRENILFSDFDNNKKVVNKLTDNILSNKINHGYIFEGPTSAEKFELAKAFAKGIVCQSKPGDGCGLCPACIKIEKEVHIDFVVIEETQARGSSTKSIKNQQIKDLQERLSKTPIEAERNIAILKQAQTISEEGYNTFLKTLEEPPEGTVLILLVENSKLIPDTIRSRCVKYFIVEEMKKDFNDSKKNTIIELVELLIEKKPYFKIKPLIDKYTKEKEDSLFLLDQLELEVRNMLINEDKRISKEFAFMAIDEIEKARTEVQRNMSKAYAIKKMVLRIGG